MQAYLEDSRTVPGAAPGIEHDQIAGSLPAPGHPISPVSTIVPIKLSSRKYGDLEDFLACHRPEWTVGAGSTSMGCPTHGIHVVAIKYDLHPLAVEDMLQKHQRPKVEAYGGEGSESWRACSS